MKIHKVVTLLTASKEIDKSAFTYTAISNKLTYFVVNVVLFFTELR